MADIADLAGEHDFNDEMVKRQLRKQKLIAPRGHCLDCGAEIGHDQIFCPTEFGCKEQYEKVQAIRKNQGLG